ncbi:CTL-like protein DDB_G0288717 [Salvia hispanica]|uniref:CTL-like protein DDB_G0288717 n=1 Tax=Salvia hispanica TaxID=49212 RepID=UPI0020097919|nr:CTL-like protein DDB_G0288717 [Salvia hispanica]
MDTTPEDPHHDSAATQPLLSKPYPTLEPPIASISEAEEDQSQFLQISYNYGPRPLKDLPFLILFSLLLLSTFALGIFASVNRNPHRHDISYFAYDVATSSCVSVHVRSPRPFSSNSSKSNLFEVGDSSISPNLNLVADFVYISSHLGRFDLVNFVNFTDSSVWESLVWTLVVTLIVSVPFLFLVLLLLKHYTKQIVYASLPFFVIVPIFVNVYWFVACTVSSTCSEAFPLAYRIVVLIFVFLIIGVIVWIFVVNWHRIELTVKVIGVASTALLKNSGLFGALPALTLGLVVCYVPIVVFLVFSSSNGEIVPREEHGEYVCVWKQDSWVPAYYTLAILTMLWSATIMVEAQVYVISGTIAQWYFSKDDSPPKHGIRSSLRNAFGPSFGTICFSGLLISIVRIVRSIVDNARQEDASGIVNLILRCCANALLSAVDFLNKFTINFAAITGEAYCSAARMTYELLKRNLLSAVFVETVSTRILSGIVLVLSAIYAILVCVLLKAAVHLGDDAYFIAFVAWILLMVVLGFFVHVLDNVIDTVYVCYAIDRDRGEVYKQDVHEVYVHLPISRSHRAGFVPRTTNVV